MWKSALLFPLLPPSSLVQFRPLLVRCSNRSVFDQSFIRKFSSNNKDEKNDVNTEDVENENITEEQLKMEEEEARSIEYDISAPNIVSDNYDEGVRTTHRMMFEDGKYSMEDFTPHKDITKERLPLQEIRTKKFGNY